MVSRLFFVQKLSRYILDIPRIHSSHASVGVGRQGAFFHEQAIERGIVIEATLQGDGGKRVVGAGQQLA